MTGPLTPRRVLWTCAFLTAVLFVVILLALRLGAVPFSLGDLGQNLWWLATGHSEKISTDFRLIMVDIRLPRILLGVVVGAALLGCGRYCFPGAAAESASGSLRTRRFQRRCARSDPGSSRGAHAAADDPTSGVSRRVAHNRLRVFPRTTPGPSRQQHAAARRHHLRVVSFRHYHVSDDHRGQPRPARHRVLVDGRSFHGSAARPVLDTRLRFLRGGGSHIHHCLRT